MVLALILAFSATTQSVRVARAGRFVAKVAPESARPMHIPFYLLIATHREQATVGGCMAHYEQLSEGRPWLRPVIIATNSDDDRLLPGAHISTFESARAARLGRVSVWPGPLCSTTKADKLNWAISKIRLENHGDFCVGIFDVDSRPTGEAIDSANNRLCVHPYAALALQQGSHYHVKLDRGQVRSSLAHAVALRQTRWSVHFEVGRLLHRDRRPIPTIPTILQPFHYVVAHGLFLTATALELAGPIKSFVVEDAYLSFALRRSNVRIEALPGLDNCEVPPTTHDIVRQKAKWFKGPQQAFRYWSALRAGRSLDLVGLVEACKLMMHCVYWIVGPVLYLAVLPAYLLWSRSYLLLGVVGLIVAVHCVAIDAMTYRLLTALKHGSGEVKSRWGPARFWRFAIFSWAAWALFGVSGVVGMFASTSSLRVRTPRTADYSRVRAISEGIRIR